MINFDLLDIQRHLNLIDIVLPILDRRLLLRADSLPLEN